MTRDEAREVVYALRDYVQALIVAHGYSGMQHQVAKKAEELESVLMGIRTRREGDD